MCFGNDGMGCEDDIAAVERVERAVSLFEEGFSCSQAVLGAYSERFGLACEAALKLSAGFGCDISTPQGKQEAEEKNLTQTICPKYVHDAARILDEMLSLDGNYDSTD
jgi:hypothetical protein